MDSTVTNDLDVRAARILVVDDEEVNVILLEETLRADAYSQVASTRDSREVVELARTFRPDLILLDLRMPHLDGFQVMEHLREAYPDHSIPVLVLTAVQDRDTRLRALSSGATDFLSKPLDLMETTLRIRNLLTVRLLYRQVIERTKELEASNRKLAASNADLEQFAYVASHDLQDPLRSITRYVQLIQRRYESQLDEHGADYISRVVAGAKRMQNLIASLLAYSRVTTQGDEPGFVDANEVLAVSLNDLAAAIDEASGSVTHSALPTVRVDGSQLQQVFTNLIGNAIKFHGDRPPEVHVEAEEREDDWLFSVRDNGIGVEPQYQEQIFVIFQRLHGRTEYPGTGIGLAMCKRIVDRHGGRIWLESEPGQGTTFFFTLPRETPVVASSD